MAVRSKRLWAPTGVGLSGITLYTCPAGETALIKHLSIYNSGATQQTCFLYINGFGSANIVIAQLVPTQQAVQLINLFMVLHPGDTFRGVVLVGDMTVTGFGAELEGVAD